MADAPTLSRAHVPTPRLFPAGVALLTALYLTFALANILRLPPLRGPDEGDHLAYVQVLRAQHALPVLPRFAAPDDPRVAEQAQHPPLYYAILAAASTVLPDPATPTGQRALKLVSVLMGLAGLLAFAACARRVWPEDDAAALLAVGFVALMPNYWVLTSHLNNSAGSLAASGVTLWLLWRALSGEPRTGRWLAVGVAAGLGMLAKITAAWLLPVIVIALYLQGRRHGWRGVAGPALAALLPTALLIGPWLAHNWLCVGTVMPQRVLGREYLPDGFLTLFFQPFAASLLLYVLVVKLPLTTLTPYWLLADSFAVGKALLLVVAGLGPVLGAAVVGAWRRRGQLATGAGDRRTLLVACAGGLVAAWFIALEAVLHDWNTGLYCGRYAVDALPALALVFTAGMRVLLPRPRPRAVGVALWLVALLVLSWAVHSYMVTFFTYR
ncbi:MAG: glycosyltransferase family 39 protein [Armatimonadetes bacterium]|nr:glycosyltransferase family 39 protein [Armatimonadota bacterium]